MHDDRLKGGRYETTSKRQEGQVGQQRLYFRLDDLIAHRSRVLAGGGDVGEITTTAWMDMFIVLDAVGIEIVFAVTSPDRHSSNPWNTEEPAAPRR